MVEVALHQVVSMVTMGNCFVSARGTMLMALLVAAAIVVRRAGFRILAAHGDLMLVNMIAMRVVKMPIVKIVFVAVVPHGNMSTVRTVHVRVSLVNLMIGAHLFSLCIQVGSVFYYGCFAGMRQCIEDQIHNVLVGEPIIDVLAPAPSHDQVLAAKYS